MSSFFYVGFTFLKKKLKNFKDTGCNFNSNGSFGHMKSRGYEARHRFYLRHKEKIRAYYYMNRERILEYQNEYNKRNIDRIRELRKKNKERINERNRAYWNANKNELNAKRRAKYASQKGRQNERDLKLGAKSALVAKLPLNQSGFSTLP